MPVSASTIARQWYIGIVRNGLANASHTGLDPQGLTWVSHMAQVKAIIICASVTLLFQ